MSPGRQAGRHRVDPPRDGIGAYSYGNAVNVVNAVNGKDAFLSAAPPDECKPRGGPPSGRRAPTGRGRKGGQHDGPPRGARRRAQGEEASRGRRRTPQGGAGPALGRAEGILAPQPPERGGRWREGPAGAGAPPPGPRGPG